MGEPIYIETWEVTGKSKGYLLDIAYTWSACPTVESKEILRSVIAEAHNCTLQRLLKTTKIEF